jgi:DNA-binding HxlR family transcriptional regulator
MRRLDESGGTVASGETGSTKLGRVARGRPRSRCPLSRLLEIVGDQWTLLVVRDLMTGKRRYTELQASLEDIPTNVLADRLKRLCAAGIVRPRRYCMHPPRVEYRLTPRGEDLWPVMEAMMNWGIRHAGGARHHLLEGYTPPSAKPPAGVRGALAGEIGPA